MLQLPLLKKLLKKELSHSLSFEPPTVIRKRELLNVDHTVVCDTHFIIHKPHTCHKLSCIQITTSHFNNFHPLNVGGSAM